MKKPYAITVNGYTHYEQCESYCKAWDFALIATNGQPSKVTITRL